MTQAVNAADNAQVTTLERTLAAGGTVRIGAEQPYRRLRFAGGEPRLVRGERATYGGRTRPTKRRSLLVLVQLTDLQLADAGSPGRFEFFEHLRETPGADAFIPGQRPQEVLGVHAVEAMARAIHACGGSPDTGTPLGLAICTGDNIDNAQLNELTWYLTLLAGGRLSPTPGGRRYVGVQAVGWPNDLYWHPDGGADRFRDRWGFPDYPGLLAEASAAFDASGVGVPWLSCFGNHDGLPFGEVVATAEYCKLLTGATKPIALASGEPPLLGRQDELFAHPEHFLSGPGRAVTAEATRTIVSRRDFVAAHLRAGGLPVGHGFDARNLKDGTVYAAYDEIEGMRVVLLDSTNLNGRSDGSFGARQLAWLEERLVEVHGRHLAPGGAPVTTGNEDRLVILASHHGLASLTNDRETADGPEEDQPRVTAAEIRMLLDRFPNVVLWLNGHRHCNAVEFRRSPGEVESGFWEVSTAALADWPSQARLVELTANDDGTLSILCTMLDHAGGPDPRHDEGLGRLASIHRELAANVPARGLGSPAEGRREDRNVELVMRAPFALR